MGLGCQCERYLEGSAVCSVMVSYYIRKNPVNNSLYHWQLVLNLAFAPKNVRDTPLICLYY